MKLDATNLAREAKLAPSTLNRFLNNDVKYLLSGKTLAAVSRISGVAVPSEVSSVVAPTRIALPTTDAVVPNELMEEAAAFDFEPHTALSPPANMEEFALIPVYDARVSAGPGAINESNPAPLHYDAFRREWVHRYTSSLEKLAVLRVAGDSMESTLYNGDSVLVDMSVARYSRDGLYVIRFSSEDETMVKRLSRQPGPPTLTIQSDNPRYKTWTGIPDDDVCVIGRVLWLGRNIG
ncbi:S24 family peptidase [Telmatospirillum sp.]|uniref:S24 family peptidase n=1 Tax=Telmatospirillum sp. TaxID=2079197 RepID=UPI00283F4F2A|nr:S24 family peptidase [Telmatospirillum sp.]MDR3439858.1 S24 family peptidase [Telmatospirillum sp.]